MPRAVLLGFFAFALSVLLLIEAEAKTTPPEGLRENTPQIFALTNARLVLSPGNIIEKGTLVIREGVIEAVGAKAAIPADALVLDMKGKTIYPGLIDSYSDWGLPKPPQQRAGGPGRRQRAQAEQPEEPRGPRYWNPNVLAHQKANELFSPDEETAGKLREQGITAVLTVPTKGVFKGISTLVNLGQGKPNDLIVKPAVAQHLSFSANSFGDDYPNSLMGAIALIRQTFLDADWYRQAQAAWNRNPDWSVRK
jgi:hypothetical protein